MIQQLVVGEDYCAGAQLMNIYGFHPRWQAGQVLLQLVFERGDEMVNGERTALVIPMRALRPEGSGSQLLNALRTSQDRNQIPQVAPVILKAGLSE